MEVGGQTVYTSELADRIVELLANGVSLKRLQEVDSSLPMASTVINWVLDDREGFAGRYARAMEIRTELDAEEMRDIADDGRNDTQRDEEGNVIVDYDHIQRSKLRVDARKWLNAHRLPNKWGDRLAHQMLDDKGEPTKPSVMVIVDGAVPAKPKE